MIFPSPSECAGILHYVPPNLSAFEPNKLLDRSGNINTLVWIGGMFDTLGCVEYPFHLAKSLPKTWSLLTCSLGSAGMSWGVKSITSDADDMAKIVTYLKEKRPRGRIIIMGHSTGCQDCMEYVVGKDAMRRPSVDAIILQAPVSDREALEMALPAAHKHEADQLALKMCREGNEKNALPNHLTRPVFGNLAITARRWLNVSSPGPDHSGADDFFSSDLSMERLQSTFGKLTAKTPLLILYSGDDESVPKKVDKQKLIQKWTDVVKNAAGCVDEENGGVVPGASHNCNGSSSTVTEDLIQRVVRFVSGLESGAFAFSREGRM